MSLNPVSTEQALLEEEIKAKKKKKSYEIAEKKKYNVTW